MEFAADVPNAASDAQNIDEVLDRLDPRGDRGSPGLV